MKNKKHLLYIIPAFILFIAIIIIKQAPKTLPWPDAPLYKIPADIASWTAPQDKATVMKMISGHYAHYDIVSYEDMTTPSPMRTFIISYGFTDFFIRDGRLFQSDRFVHAEQKLNQVKTTSMMSDKAVSAIDARTTEVDLVYSNGMWTINRPPTPTLLGIKGDPSLPLSQDPKDTNITDPDEDGFPGVTVHLNISGFIKGDIYITRKEVYRNHLTIYSPDMLWGYLVDTSEQFVVGASLPFLSRPSHNEQHKDPGMNPVILIRVDKDIDTWEELKNIRDDIFPVEPSFY